MLFFARVLNFIAQLFKIFADAMNGVAACQYEKNQAQQKRRFFHVANSFTAHEHQQSVRQRLLLLPLLGSPDEYVRLHPDGLRNYG